jgi:hypothetical protein
MKRSCVSLHSFVDLCVLGGLRTFLTTKDTKGPEGSTKFKPVYVPSKPCVPREQTGFESGMLSVFPYS